MRPGLFSFTVLFNVCLTCGRSHATVDRPTYVFTIPFHNFWARNCVVLFLLSDMMRPVNTKPMRMRAWQTRAEVLGHIELVDCEDQTWSDTTDGKWHPTFEEPEEGAKDNISDISYIATPGYSMPELGVRSETAQLSDGWTQTMPDGDHEVQVAFLIEEINCRKMAFDHMCSTLKKQKIVIDSDMHVMLAAFSAMNKRIKAIFDQVDSGKEYNEAIDTYFNVQVF